MARVILNPCSGVVSIPPYHLFEFEHKLPSTPRARSHQVKNSFSETFAGRVVSLRPTLKECADGHANVSEERVDMTRPCRTARRFTCVLFS